MTHLTIRLLGTPGIVREGVPVAVDTRKATALLAYLAVTGRSHARETLAALLWPEYDDEHARAALRRTLSTLRTALGAPCLAVDRETIGLIPGPNLWIDVSAFYERLAACGTHGHPTAEVCPACLSPLAEAAALYGGDFLAGFTLRDSANFDDWQFSQAETLRGALADALEKLTRGYGNQGDYAAALEAARRWLALDPLREEAHCQVMRLYAWAGQRNAALHQYRECASILEQELGVAPLAETTALYEAIKGNRLPRPAPAGSHTPAEGPVAAGLLPAGARPQAAMPLNVWHALEPSSAGDPAGPKLARPFPLVGRAAELKGLIRAYEQHAAGGYFVALEGEPGIGKTRLAEEFLTATRARGATAITMRCFEGETAVAYAAIADGLRALLREAACAEQAAALAPHWLSEAGRLLPELLASYPELPPPPPVDALGGQSRFFEALRQVLTSLCGGSAPSVIFFDDVQWADSATLDFLSYLVRRLPGQPAFLLAAWREEEPTHRRRLAQLVADAQRGGRGMVVRLTRLKLADVFDLLRAAAGQGLPLPTAFGGRLHHETEGLPLFLVAYLEALAQGHETGEAGDWPVPNGVTDLLRARVDAVGDAARQALQAASVIGRYFDLEVLQAISGRSSEELVSALEALTGRGIIQEIAGEAGATPLYTFTHEKLQALVYDETSLARRRLLHGRAARSLAEWARLRRDPAAHAAQIGRHFRLAGQDADAAGAFVLAGDHARSLYANAEALAHYQAALALGHGEVCRLHEAIGDMHTLLGTYGAALTSYEVAAALCDPASPALAEIEHKLGNVHARRGEWPSAETHFSAALDIVSAGGGSSPSGTSASGTSASILADWSLAVHAQGQTERALALAGDALTMAESADDRHGMAQAHNILGILARGAGDVAGAAMHLEQSLAIAGTFPDPSRRIAALNNLALARADSGELAEALTLAEQALALGIELGDRHREAALRNNLADLLHAAGRRDEAMAQLKQGVVIFAEIGGEAGDTRPEIWKLTEW